ncbi:MAG TPA: hypothetical protein VFT72_20595 [Opitutaceae bacterium]|nr:hypothetical protein [Opitutaceae bacterium]
MKPLMLLFAVFGLLFAACSTPESRIKKNPEIFSKLSPEEQQLIKEGKVGIGFTPEMVKLAIGDPDRVTTRTDANGVTETWRYVTYESDTGMLLYRGYYHRYYRWGDPMFPYYTAFPARRERDFFRVVFHGGKVTAIEEEKP